MRMVPDFAVRVLPMAPTVAFLERSQKAVDTHLVWFPNLSLDRTLRNFIRRSNRTAGNSATTPLQAGLGQCRQWPPFAAGSSRTCSPASNITVGQGHVPFAMMGEKKKKEQTKKNKKNLYTAERQLVFSERQLDMDRKLFSCADLTGQRNMPLRCSRNPHGSSLFTGRYRRNLQNLCENLTTRYHQASPYPASRVRVSKASLKKAHPGKRSVRAHRRFLPIGGIRAISEFPMPVEPQDIPPVHSLMVMPDTRQDAGAARTSAARRCLSPQ